jgi:DNA-binding MarR family transcriptional regulator
MSDIVSNAGLPTDHDAFKVMVEIEIIAKQADRLFDRMLPPGMTRAQFGVLNRLARLDTRETITEIAQAFGVSQPTMSSTVRKLLDKGFVMTDHDPDDARRKVVVLSETGAAFRTDVTKQLQPLFAEAAAHQNLLDWSALLQQLAILRAELETR